MLVLWQSKLLFPNKNHNQKKKKNLLCSMEPHQFNFNIEFIIVINYILKIFS